MALAVKAQEDVTSLLTNPDFESDASGWNIVGGNMIAATAANYGYNGTKFIESWVAAPNTLSDRNWSQTIEVPNGVYVVKSLAHAILQSDASVVPSGVAIYANKDEVAVTTTNTNPPTEYSVATVVTDGKLTVGCRISACNVNWVAWDNVRVSQYTGATEEEAKLAWMRDELETLGTTAMELIENPMSQELAAAITATVNAISDVATYEAAAALLETLKAQVADAKLCIAVYEDYLGVVAVANDELDRGFTEGVDEFSAAIAAAKAAHENGTLSLEEVEAAIVKLEDDIFTFQMLNADGTERFDVTGRFMTNPTLRKGNQGWSGSAPGLEHEVMEFYNCDFDMYQELTGLPNGMYVVQVQAFYRVGGNDGGAAYEEGTENISAELYANNKSVPLLSLYKYRASEMGVTGYEVLNDYVNMRVAINEAFNLINPETEMGYYAENELTVVVQDGTLKIGLRNTGHKSSSWCAFRDFKLYYYGNFPAVVLMENIAAVEEWLGEYGYQLPINAEEELYIALAEAYEYVWNDSYGNDEVNAQVTKLDMAFAGAKHVLAMMDELRNLIVKVENELIDLEYPGLDELFEAYDMAYYLSEEGTYVDLPENHTTEEYYVEAIDAFKKAINDYYMSQEASMENPADYTFLVGLPNFVEEMNDVIPAPWHVNNQYNNMSFDDVWVGTCRPEAEGGEGLPGFNSWASNFISMDVYQDIENLPNGVYTVSAQAITQSLGRQHVYATSSMGMAVSPEMTIEGWDSYEWERLTTNYVVVTDGKLRIGFASECLNGDISGWFQVTGFKLYYHGEDTEGLVDYYAMTAQDVVAEPSSIVNIPIELKNSTAVTAFQFDLYLPYGVSPLYDVVDGEIVYDVTFNTDRTRYSHVLAASVVSDGALRVVAYSTEDAPFIGNEGVVVNVAVAVEDFVSAGDYAMNLRNVRMVKSGVSEVLGANSTATLSVVRNTLMGDVNSDGKYSISDVVMVVNAVLEKPQANFNVAVADMNGDGNITMGDAILVLRLVLTDGKAMAPARSASPDAMPVLSAGDLAAMADGRVALPVALDNSEAYSAFQLDVVLPAGVEITEATLTGRAKASHAVAWNTLSDGKVRIVAYALDNAAFRGNEGALLNLVLTAAGEQPADATITLADGLFATVSGAEHRAEDVSVMMRSEATGVDALSGAIRVSGAEGAVVVQSAADAAISIYAMTGQLVQQAEVKGGESRIALPAGVYVINGNKITVK